MHVLVLGGGGREHALAWRLARDPQVTQVSVAPGNPGSAAVGRQVSADLNDSKGLISLAALTGVDLTVVGPEAPLEKGVARDFRAAGRLIVGPGPVGAALECSKVHAKHFMARQGIPTARFVVCDAAEQAIEVVRRGELGFPVVVKADGLAAGKGVVIAADRSEAEAAVRAMMVERQFGAAGARVVLEECLTGPEVSFFALCDGTRAIALGSAQDHKRIFDDDRGPNTGGMGAFAPSPLVTDTLQDMVMREIVGRVLDGMRAEGEPYIGFLYVSLMLTDDGPKVIEFNVRFGDPEAQVVLPSIETGFAAALRAAAEGRLDRLPADAITHVRDRFVGVVLASRGYPASAESGQVIDGLERAAAVPGALVFHAGTKQQDRAVVTAGGRVLTVVGRGPTYANAMATAYRAAEMITFDGVQYRHDIGKKAVMMAG